MRALIANRRASSAHTAVSVAPALEALRAQHMRGKIAVAQLEPTRTAELARARP